MITDTLPSKPEGVVSLCVRVCSLPPTPTPTATFCAAIYHGYNRAGVRNVAIGIQLRATFPEALVVSSFSTNTTAADTHTHTLLCSTHLD